MNATYDLAVNYPLRTRATKQLAAALARPDIDAAALAYPWADGAPDVRRAFAQWMTEVCAHGAIDPEQLVVTLGARQALVLALRPAATPISPTVMVDELTFHGFRKIAQHLGMRCLDVPMDEQGMRADALEDVARRSGSRVVYLQPTLHNPTTLTMPASRRAEIMEVAERWDLTLIEGDVYSPLVRGTPDMLPSFTALAPHRTTHAGGLGKVLGPGLRLGWLRLPTAGMKQRAVHTLAVETDGLPALYPRIAARWITDGTAVALLDELAAAMRERASLARHTVGPDLVTHGASLHAWLPHPDAEAVYARLEARGVRTGDVLGYVGDGQPGKGLRLCLGAEEDIGRLEAALRIVADCR